MMIMKRFFALAMCILVLCSGAVIASAEEASVYENAGQLYDAWTSQYGVPDYITGVWSTDGGHKNLTFGVLKGDAGEHGKQEIFALVRDDSTVTIVYQTYSRNYLYQIQNEIEDTYFDADFGLVTVGVAELENKLCVEVHRDFAENVDTIAMIRRVTDQYGDAVSFSFVDAYPEILTGSQPPAPTGPVLAAPNPQDHFSPLVFLIAVCVIAATFLFFTEIRRRRLIAVAIGNTSAVMDENPVDAKGVENAIRESKVKPSKALDDRVMQSVHSEND